MKKNPVAEPTTTLPKKMWTVDEVMRAVYDGMSKKQAVWIYQIPRNTLTIDVLVRVQNLEVILPSRGRSYIWASL